MAASSPRMVRRPGIDSCNIIARWYARAVLMVASSPLDGTPSWRRWLHHHRRMVCRPASMVISSPSDGTPDQGRWTHHHRQMERRTSIDGYVITAGSYVGPASMAQSSPPDGMPDRTRWMHHHRRMVRQTGVNGYIIIVVSYAGPVVVRHRHCRMVRRANGGKIPSPPARNRRR
jgi:hypothetical protein